MLSRSSYQVTTPYKQPYKYVHSIHNMPTCKTADPRPPLLQALYAPSPKRSANYRASAISGLASQQLTNGAKKVLSENVLRVSQDETRFAHGSVSDYHNFQQRVESLCHGSAYLLLSMKYLATKSLPMQRKTQA